MDRFSTFPFSVGCISQSTVDVVGNRPKKLPTSRIQLINGRSTKSSSFLPLPKPNISAGILKVIKGFKSLSYLFQFYGEADDDDDEIEMEIGFPTDVQHVAHIGWDGFNTGIKSCGDKGPDLLSLPTISRKRLELAMAAQARGQ